MDIEHYYDSIFSNCTGPENPVKSLDLPIFCYISQAPQLNTNISEKEEIESLENISVHLKKDANSYFAIAKIQESTQHESVRHWIAKKFLQCIEAKIEEVTQCNYQLKQQNTLLIKKSNSFDMIISSKEDEVPEDNDVKILLETIPLIYQHSSIEEMNEFNKSLTRLLSAFAPNVEYHQKDISHLPFFKLTAECVNNIFLLAKKTIVPIKSANILIQNIISATFNIYTGLSLLIDNPKFSDMKISSYFSCLIHLIAEGVDLLAEKELIIIQQLFVTLVMSWDDLLSSFPSRSKDLKKISLLIPPMIKFRESAKTTSTLCQLVQFQRSSEDIARAVNRYFDLITVKEVSAMPRVDALILLSIGVLEKTRAKAGDFATFFDYFTYDYYPEFTACLRNLITPLFHFFMSHVYKKCTADQRNVAIDALVQRCFKNYLSKNIEFTFLIDKIAPELFKNYQLSLFSPKTVSAFIGSLNSAVDENSSRFLNLKIIIKSMIES